LFVAGFRAGNRGAVPVCHVVVGHLSSSSSVVVIGRVWPFPLHRPCNRRCSHFCNRPCSRRCRCMCSLTYVVVLIAVFVVVV
jgi:hypothetical protein